MQRSQEDRLTQDEQGGSPVQAVMAASADNQQDENVFMNKKLNMQR